MVTTAPTLTSLPTLPSLVVGTVSHRRRTPMEHAFTHRHYQWLVDVDDLPRHRWPLSLLTRITADGHLDDGRLGVLFPVGDASAVLQALPPALVSRLDHDALDSL